MSKKAIASLDELDRAVLEAYIRAADSSTRFERSYTALKLSVQDLGLNNNVDTNDNNQILGSGGGGDSSSNGGGGHASSSSSSSLVQRTYSTVLLLEILQEWRNLVQSLQQSVQEEDPAFQLEYTKLLWTAFRGCFDIDKQHYRHLKTLVSLLTNTVENRHRDSSTECRFVTLLEVLLSYGSSDGRPWTPSEEVSGFWVRLLQRIPDNVPPTNFRRKAYRVLVSLSWVPSSTGLLEACSFEGNRQSIDARSAPPHVRRHLEKIVDKPRPRYDCVNQLLDRLKDETDVCVAVTSERRGMGKTTLAALVASHPSILRVFQVLWLNITEEKLTYDVYIRHLNDLCQQLAITDLDFQKGAATTTRTSSTEPASTTSYKGINNDDIKRMEEPALRKMREEVAMVRARDLFAQALQQRDENYLLVLDNMTDSKTIEWFRFNERQSIIVTTPNSGANLKQGIDWTVDLAPMSVAEAIELFLAEATFPTTHVLGLTTEVRKIVQGCECHPLVVRTVGRWFKLKMVTAGIERGLEELLHDMNDIVTNNSNIIHSNNHSMTEPSSPRSRQRQQLSHPQTIHENNEDQSENGTTTDTTNNNSNNTSNNEKMFMSILFDYLSGMMSPTRIDGIENNNSKNPNSTLQQQNQHLNNAHRPSDKNNSSVLFLLCLTSMVVVFPDQTPLDSILLLWDHLLKVESSALDELFQNGDPTPRDIRKQAWMVAEGLTHMGVISLSEKADGHAWVEVHHWLYKEYALYAAKTQLLNNNNDGSSSSTSSSYGTSYERTLELWNRAFVTAYFTQRIEGNHNNRKMDDNSWEYAIVNLPSHIFKARMFPMAETILGEEHFFRARVEAMGWDRAVDTHIGDCLHLQRALVQAATDEAAAGSSSSSSNTQQQAQPNHVVVEMSPVFGKTAAIITTRVEGTVMSEEEEQNFIIDASRALLKIGLALAENGYYDEAVIQLENAQNLLPQSQELRASILYGSAWVLLATNRTEKALKKIRASRKIMDEYVSHHVLYNEALQLQGEALVGECEYKEAAEFFEAAVMHLHGDAQNNRIVLGTTLHKKGRLHHIMGELDMAKQTLKDCVTWKNDIGEVSIDLALVHSLLADIALETRKVSEAREHFESALQVLHTLKCGRDQVDLCLLTGKLQYLRNEFIGSLESLERARKAINEAPILFMERAPYDLRCIARLYKKHGQLDTSFAILQESLMLTTERPFSLERSAGLHDLAEYMIEQDEVNEGLFVFEQSLEIRIVKLGECVQVLDTLSSIGSVHLSLGALEEALAVFEKVNELTKRIAPNDVERFAGVLYSIGEVYDAKRDYSAAIARFDECMEVLKRDRSEDHPHIAKALQRLGDVSAARKELDKAYDYYCEALRIRQMHQDERALAETMHSIGVLTRKRHNIEAAQEPLLNALEIRRRLGNGRETGQTLLEIGNLYRLQSDTAGALSIYEKSLEVLDEKDDIRGCVYSAIGHMRVAAKQDNEALFCFERARDIRMAAYGKDNLKTCNVSRSLGLLKFLANNGDEALVHLNEFIRVIELNDDDDNEEESDDIGYVLAIMLMSDIHRSNGRDDQSRNLIQIAREVCDESEQIQEELPALAEMVERRRNVPEEAPKSGGLLKRFNLSDETGGNLSITAKEEALLRNITFLDD